MNLTSYPGLSSSEAQRKLREEGLNEIPVKKGSGVVSLIIKAFKEPMIFLLISCGAIYFFLGDPAEALMLLGFLLIIIFISLYQERKTERSLEALRDLSSPRALVIRDGKPIRVAGREVVMDDLVIVKEGDRVPADGAVLSSTHLAVDESLLTGESVPVSKTVSSPVFSSTVVVRGQAMLRITATGLHTEVGKIGKVLKETREERTFLQRETSRLVKKIAVGAGALSLLMVLLYGLTRSNWIEGLLAGLTLAMAILPNEIPAVLVIFLALGAWRISKKQVLTRRIPAVEMLGAATVLCVDKTGTLTQNQMTIQGLLVGMETLNLRGYESNELPETFHELVEFGILASQKDPFDPMELAFHRLGNAYLTQTEHLHRDWTLLREYPLSEELMALSHVWESPDRTEYVIAAKGAPEAIVDLCHLPEERALKIFDQVGSMAREGLRVLGVAKASFRKIDLPPQQHDFDFVFLGLVGLEDPVRPGVMAAIDECHSAGIRVVMITGDHPETARSIARQIHLKNPENVITGMDLEMLAPETLRALMKTTHVFARTLPEQKLKLVEALKSDGDVVAMTGDGVNDAPALKAAHIGIAMGSRGSDVARESASLVLLNDDFTSIVESIKMGRRVFENLSHSMIYLLAVHIPITAISILPVFLGLPLILLPIHIAFLHLIIEPACTVVFEAESPDPELMKRPPRPPNQPLFTKRMLFPALLQGVSVFVAILLIYKWSLSQGVPQPLIRAVTFSTLILANLGLMTINRPQGRSLRDRLRYAPSSFWWIMSTSLVMLGLIVYVPALNGLFKVSALSGAQLSLSLLGALLSLGWIELVRRGKNKNL